MIGSFLLRSIKPYKTNQFCENSYGMYDMYFPHKIDSIFRILYAFIILIVPIYLHYSLSRHNKIMTAKNVSPSFTRYLYDKTEVKHSLLFALFNRQREEALFWTYELYFSGFEDELVEWLRWIYSTFYAIQNTLFTELFEINLSRLHTLPDQDERDCLVGTIVSNLAHRAYSIQMFTLEYLEMNIPNLPIPENNHRFLIRFRPRDLEDYRTVDKSSFRYLQEVVKYSIHKNESLFLQQHVFHESRQIDNKAWLVDWLYYCVNTPYWQNILKKYPSFQTDDATQTATFTSDDELEAFYDQYGPEPDEQPDEIHRARGVDVHGVGLFSPISKETFYDKYK